MRKRQKRPRMHSTKALVRSFCVILPVLLSFLFVPFEAAAHTAQEGATTAGKPTFHVSAGFNARFRDGNWVPVQIALLNDGPDFSGTLSVNVPSPYAGTGAIKPASLYQQPVNLASGARKQITIYAPFYFGSPGSNQNIAVDLLDTNKHVVATQLAGLHTLGASDIFIGILSDQLAGFGALNSVTLPNPSGSLVTEQLNASTFPSNASALKNFDLLILDNFTSSTLSHAQLGALLTWVKQGGTLLLAGGPEWRRTLGTLPSQLVPVSIIGTQQLDPGVQLLSTNDPPKEGEKQDHAATALPASLLVSMAAPNDGSSVILVNGSTPLLVQASQGRGRICYLAFDPTLTPIASWSGASALWKQLLLRALGEQLLPSPISSVASGFSVTDVSGDMNNLLQSLLPNTFPPVWFLLVLLLCYVLVLGPLRFLLVRVLKSRDWSWRIALSSIALFSLISYGAALQQKGASIAGDGISVMQLAQADTNTTLAHTTTYLGIFVPNQGDFQVHVPGDALVQQGGEQTQFSHSSTPVQLTSITSSSNSTDVLLYGSDNWKMRSLVAEEDETIQGGMFSRLTLQNGSLEGTVTNALPYALDNAYVLSYKNFFPVGNLRPGQTKHVHLSLTASSSGQDIPLVEQIAQYENASTHVSTYEYGSSQPQSTIQREITILSNLSGEVSSCIDGPCYIIRTPLSNGLTYPVGAGPYATAESDPLLMPGAPATLIGWINRLPGSINDVSINGNHFTGTLQTFVQAPLSVDVSGPFTLPQSFTHGRLVDVQGQSNNAQVLAPDIYGLSTGSMTFEFTLPNLLSARFTSLTVTEPKYVSQYIGNLIRLIPGTISNVNQVHANLYNWQTHVWDAIPINQYTLSTRNAHAYMSPTGRILVQFVNQNASLGTVLLGRPLLQLQGTT